MTAIHDDLDRVAGQESTLAVRSLAPVKHGAPGEVAAAPNQGEALGQHVRIAGPGSDDRVRSHDPALVVGVKIDRHTTEGVAPVHQRCVKMRV